MTDYPDDFALTQHEWEAECLRREVAGSPGRLDDYIQLAETQKEIIHGLDCDLAQAIAERDEARAEVATLKTALFQMQNAAIELAKKSDAPTCQRIAADRIFAPRETMRGLPPRSGRRWP